MAFTCNVCGRSTRAARDGLDREDPSCEHCGSSVRYRAIVHQLSVGLFGESLALPDFPQRPELRGVGFSDWPGYAEPLAARLGYRNTHLDAEPTLDLTAVPERLAGTLDFVLCSEVLEHVEPPVERAFAGLARLLRPGGLLVVTVPYSFDDDTVEHFPSLHEHALVDFHGRPILVNRALDGRWEVFDELAFHGGIGETLELRLFSLAALLRQLEGAGFVAVAAHDEETPERGIVWPKPWSHPVTARRAAAPGASPGPARATVQP